MSTSPNLPLGAFITTLGGRRCTALPRTDVNSQTISSTTNTSTSPPSFPSPLSLSSSPSSASSPPFAAAGVSEPPQALTTNAATTPTPPATTSSTSIAQFSILASSPEAVSSSSDVAILQTQASVADTSNAASSTVNAISTAAVTSATSLVAPPPQSEVLQTDVSTTAAAFTTIGINNPSSSTSSTTTSQQAAGATTTLVAVSGGTTKSSTSSNSNSAVAVAGGVIGGLAVIGLAAFFIWFWRRRILRKRRSTLLTPLSVDPSFGGLGEKGPYAMSRGSVGPAPRSNKMKAALRAQYGRVRGRFERSGSIRSISSHTSGRSVDMNRGNSQFMDTSPMMDGRKGSNASMVPPRGGNGMSVKERVMEMLGRFRGQQSETPTFEDQNRNDIFAARGIGGSVKSNNTTKTRPLTNKPDFLTLLNMDDGELDREAQRRRVSRTRDGRGGSLGSTLGGLHLDLGNPFSDANAIPRKPGPLVVSAADNPFSDANAMAGPSVPQPSTYVNDLRRSRGMSVGTISIDLNKSYDLHNLRVVNEISRPPSGTGNGTSMYFRDSTSTVESFATKRNKFRSDPFDLEPLSYVPDNPLLPGGRFSNTGSIGITYQGTSPGVPTVPKMTHARNGSDLSSRYTSGISDDATFDDWSDPGPDVGPGALHQGGGSEKFEASRRSSGAAAYSPVARSGPYDDNNRAYSGPDSRPSSGKSSLKMGYAL